MIWEVILTTVILAGAVAWAGRRLWRIWHPGAGDGQGCGGCDGCTMSEPPPQQLHELQDLKKREP